MTDASGIAPNQDALARWIAANVNTVSKASGAGPGILQGAWNWVPSQPTRDTFATRWGEERRPNQIHDAVSYPSTNVRTIAGRATGAKSRDRSTPPTRCHSPEQRQVTYLCFRERAVTDL